jgi:Uma2 family endonuclease
MNPMSTITPTPPLPSPAPGMPPHLYRMTIDEYERIVDGLDDSRVELIDGYLVRKMGKKPPHVSSVKKAFRALIGMLPRGWTWQLESPVRIPDFDEPKPDITILRGSDDDYETRTPEAGDVGLLTEVSDTTLARDRGEKLLAYAKGGIPVYWIVNLVDRRVEVYSNPGPAGYASREDFPPGQEVPVVIGGVEVGRIAVSDILPRQRS